MNVTKDQLVEALGYQWVEHDLHEGVSRFLWWKSPYRHHEFRICGAGVAEISLLFNAEQDDDYALIHLAFGPWHTHIDTGSEESDLRRALEMASDLVQGRKCLQFQEDSKGRYLCGYLAGADERVEPGWSRLTFEPRTPG